MKKSLKPLTYSHECFQILRLFLIFIYLKDGVIFKKIDQIILELLIVF